MFEELPSRPPVSLVDQPVIANLDTDEQVELAFGSLNLGDIDAEEPIG